MAMLKSFSIIAMVLLIAMSGTVTSRFFEENSVPAGGFSPLAPSPQRSPAEVAHDKYLEDCAAKLTEECGEEMFSYVFENGTLYTRECCTKLLSIGKECHDAMTEYSNELPQYKPSASLFKTRSDQIWTTCSSGSASRQTLSQEAPSPAGEFSPLAPSPRLSPAAEAHAEYLEKCADKLTEECGEEMFSYVFENATTYSNACCEKLVAIGTECHNAMTEYSVKLPQYKPNAAVYLARSDQIWNKCSSGASPKTLQGVTPSVEAPALSPAESGHDAYLEGCADKLTETCGEEVFSYVFENATTYTPDCCKKMVAAGKKCHDDMINYSVGLPQYKANASVFLARSDQLWNKCSAA